MNIDALTGVIASRLYFGTSLINQFQNASVETGYYVNQETAYPLFQLYQLNPGYINTYPWDATLGERFGWLDSIVFNLQTGLPELELYYAVPTLDNQANFVMRYYTSVYEVSNILLEALILQEDRMYMFFNNGGGVLIGASHGKFFSHSEIDYRFNNPLINPPPISEFRTYTALNSTDMVIQSSAEYLLSIYHGWDNMPALNAIVSLFSQNYWISVSPLTSQVIHSSNIVSIF